MQQTIITIQEADDHLRLDLDSPDPRRADLESKLDQAVGIIYDYIEQPFPPDSPTPEVEPHVRSAILITLTGLFDGRTPDDILLSKPIVDVLMRTRMPVMS